MQKRAASKLPTKQKVYLGILLLGYLGISIFGIFKVLLLWSNVENDMSSFLRNCHSETNNLKDEQLDEFKKHYDDFGVWGIIQGIVFIILLIIDLMIFIIDFISISWGNQCLFNCCSICRCSKDCLECGEKCANCIFENAINNPVIIQFFLGVLSLIATIVVLANSKKGESLSESLNQKCNVGGYDTKNIHANLVIVIVFLIVILFSSIVYWILSKCYFNKISPSDTNSNTGNNAELNSSNNSSNKAVVTNSTGLNLATKNEFKMETSSNKNETKNSNINNVSDLNANKPVNYVVNVENNINNENNV